MTILGIYENLLVNNQKDEQQISPSALTILDSINTKKFKNPIIFQISSNDRDEILEGQPQTEIVFRVFKIIILKIII